MNSKSVSTVTLAIIILLGCSFFMLIDLINYNAAGHELGGLLYAYACIAISVIYVINMFVLLFRKKIRHSNKALSIWAMVFTSVSFSSVLYSTINELFIRGSYLILLISAIACFLVTIVFIILCLIYRNSNLTFLSPR